MGPEPDVVQGRIFGLNLSSHLPLRYRLASMRGPPDLTLFPVDNLQEPSGSPIYESPLHDSTGRSVLEVHPQEGGDLLRFPGVADFLVGQEEVRLRLADPALEHMIEIRFLGAVLAYFLERQGVLAMHASAVSVDGRAVAFLAGKEGGKSTMAATLVKSGCRLLADDLLPVEWSDGRAVARPAHPNMRLSPDQMDLFLPDAGDFPLVHPDYPKRLVPVGDDAFGSFEPNAVPLGSVYLLARRSPDDPDQEVHISEPGGAEAAMEFLRCSFAPVLVQGLGWQGRRMDRIAKTLSMTRIRRVEHPSGFEHLPRLLAAVSEDLAKA